jgi:hypothetical protein
MARILHEIGLRIVATRGTAAALEAAGVPVTAVNKVAEGRPHIVDMLKNDEIAMVINTVEESAARSRTATRSAARRCRTRSRRSRPTPARAPPFSA